MIANLLYSLKLSIRSIYRQYENKYKKLMLSQVYYFFKLLFYVDLMQILVVCNE